MSAPDNPTFVKSNLRGRCCDSDIAGRGNHRSGASRRPIESGNDWMTARSDGPDKSAGQAREIQQPANVPREQWPDDVVNIASHKTLVRSP